MAERENDFVPYVSLGGPGDGEVAFESFDIAGIRIEAAFDSEHRLLFVLDATKDKILPNVTLVLADRDGRKWDDILQNDFGVDPEAVRPRINNKYQKLDIDYEGLDHYADAIRTGDGGGLVEWRMKSSNRQKELRMNDARHEISLAEATVAEAEKTIAELDEFIKLQKDKLRAAKKAIGTEPPKDSAAKILRYEARIDRAAAKKARSQRRLRRAQKRIDSSEKLLNNYGKTLIPREEEMNENEVRPLFTEDPNIMDNENAFKPVSFSTPPPAAPVSATPAPAVFEFVPEFVPPPQPARAAQPVQPAVASDIIPSVPAPMPIARPVSPISGNDIRISTPEGGRASGAYYMLLLLLIALSIFTLYLYQKKMSAADTPHIAATQSPVPEEIVDEPIPEFIAEPEVASEPEPFIEPAIESEPAPVIEPEVEPEFESEIEPEIEPEIERPEIFEETDVIMDDGAEAATPIEPAPAEFEPVAVPEEYDAGQVESDDIYENENPEPVAEDAAAFGEGIEE